MNEGTSPTLRLWQLAEFLRERREELNWTMDDAAKRLQANSKKSWSRSKVQRIEHRLYAPKPVEVEQISNAYKLTDSESAELLHMCQDARNKGWWQGSRLPPGTMTLVGLERAADTIRQFENALLPGLLQTPAFVRAIMTSLAPLTQPEVQEERIAARLARQHVLQSTNPPKYHAIIAESVLCWPVGGPPVMREQIDRLIDLAGAKNIILQVLPFTASPNIGLEGPFTTISLPQLTNDVGFVEGRMGAIYIEDKDSVRDCVATFTLLSDQSLSPSDTVTFLRNYRSKYE